MPPAPRAKGALTRQRLGKLRRQPGLTAGCKAKRELGGRHGKHRETEGRRRASPPGQGCAAKRKEKRGDGRRKQIPGGNGSSGNTGVFINQPCTDGDTETCRSGSEGIGACTHVPWALRVPPAVPAREPGPCHAPWARRASPRCPGHPRSSPCHRRCLLPAPCRAWASRRQQSWRCRCCPGDVRSLPGLQRRWEGAEALSQRGQVNKWVQARLPALPVLLRDPRRPHGWDTGTPVPPHPRHPGHKQDLGDHNPQHPSKAAQDVPSPAPLWGPTQPAPAAPRLPPNPELSFALCASHGQKSTPRPRFPGSGSAAGAAEGRNCSCAHSTPHPPSNGAAAALGAGAELIAANGKGDLLPSADC